MDMSISERPIEITTNNGEAEILLLDSNFKILHRGPSPLLAKVLPGFYIAKVVIGDRENQLLLQIEPGEEPLKHSINAPPVETPLPLEDNASISVAALMVRAFKSLDEGSDENPVIHLCFRRPRASAGDAIAQGSDASVQDLLNRISVTDSAGIVANTPISWLDDDQYVSIALDVKPGACTLVYRDLSDTELALAMPTVRGWLLQVFVPVISSMAGLIPDFKAMSVFYANSTGRHTLDELRIVETVRQSFSSGRLHISRQVLQALMCDKFENPMLGIYAAHHLLGNDPDEFLPEVLLNTTKLLGDSHPDIVALTCAVTPEMSAEARQAKLSSLNGPPLLAKSWDLLVAEADKLPIGTLKSKQVFALASRLCMQGMYMGWRTEQPVSSPTAVQTEPVTRTAPTARFDATLPPKPLPVRRTKLEAAVRLTSIGVAKVTEMVTKLRETFAGTSGLEAGTAAAQIEGIDSVESAAQAMKTLALEYDWDMLTAEIRENDAWLAALSPLQKSLIMSLREIKQSQQLTAGDVDGLLKANRVPLEILALDLQQLEIGGWAVQNTDGLMHSAAQIASDKLETAMQRFRTRN